MKIDVEQTLKRRADVLLEMRVRALARNGKSVSAAYAPQPAPKAKLPRIVWT